MTKETKSSAVTRLPATLRKRLEAVKILLCDVDGVLTDAGIFVGAGIELKRFDIQDGLGMVTLRREGIRVGWISSRPSSATTQRAAELKIDFLLQQKGSKVDVIEQLLTKEGLSWSDVCYIGDDIVDLGPLKRAGVAVAVPNAAAEAKALAHYMTRAPGGHGAVREVVELILKVHKKWDRVVRAQSG